MGGNGSVVRTALRGGFMSHAHIVFGLGGINNGYIVCVTSASVYNDKYTFHLTPTIASAQAQAQYYPARSDQNYLENSQQTLRDRLLFLLRILPETYRQQSIMSLKGS